ncbi:MAG: hypothetical protein M0Q87_06405 [Ottowia sp.]|nr:hypothetical protein [Ottowia sp.]
MNTITFQFSLDQRVRTPFNSIGIVSMQAHDDGGVCYFVKTEHGGAWFKEGQLSHFDAATTSAA